MGPSILIADDQPGVRQTLKGILNRKGFRVYMVEDGEHAIDVACAVKLDVILMDIKMPGLNGVDTFIRIKALCPGVPVILMTAFALEDDIARAVKEGVHAVIAKPFEMSALIKMLEDCVHA